MKNLKYSVQLITALLSCLFVWAACNEDPYIVGYKGFTCTAKGEEYAFNSGSTGIIEAKVIAEKGLKSIKVTVGAWTSGSGNTEDIILVKGSPKTYDMSYSFQIPDNANADNEISFLFEDYAGATIEYKASVATVTDDTAPIIETMKPLSPDNKFSPLENVPFEIRVTDNKKIKEAVLSCEAISYSKTFGPAETDSKTIHINEFVGIPVEGSYLFKLKARDAQDNVVEQEIPVIITMGSKPAILNQMTKPLIGVAGGKLAFHFKISTDSEHTITKVEVKIKSDDVTATKEFAPDVQIAELNDMLDIPATADSHANDLKITVTATNNSNETAEWSGNCSIIKNIYIYGKGTLAKSMMEYSLPMKHIDGTNQFTCKTYVEAINEGFKFWNGTFTEDATHERKAIPIQSWGKGDESSALEGSVINMTANGTGYYIITFDPITLTYSVTNDTSVPSVPIESGKVYAQVNNLLYKSGNDWIAANWNFLPLTPFPGNQHRFYMDVKTNSTGNAWEQAFFGLAAQSNDKGTMYSIAGSGGYHYTFNGFTSTLKIVHSWDESGKMSEKGTTPNGTSYRLVVDTYLMQLGWATADKYSYPTFTK